MPEQGKNGEALYVVLGLLVAAWRCVMARWKKTWTKRRFRRVTTKSKTLSRVLKARTNHQNEAPRLRMVLAFVPSSLVLGVTTNLDRHRRCPAVLGDSLTLSSHVRHLVCKRQVISRRVMSRAVGGAALVVVSSMLGRDGAGWFLVWCISSFSSSRHSSVTALGEERPPTSHLASLFMDRFGGALGGVLNALIAPALFDTVLEYPLMIVLACTLRPSDGTVENKTRARWLDVLLPVGVGALAAALGVLVMQFEIGHVERIALVIGLPLMLTTYFFAERPARFALGLAAVMLGSLVYTGGSGRTLAKERNFYGTLRVTESASSAFHRLQHGSTIHGRQFVGGVRRCEPLSYITARVRSARFDVFNARMPAPNVAVVGLGTGATVAYAQPNQQWTFYEINPAVIEIARDPKLFTYLRDCHANAPVEIALGDARLQLQNAPPHTYGLIVLDAFSSDAIPAHLLTKEALDLYLSKLAEGGLIAFHVSSRSLNLHRVVDGLAQNANLYALMFDDEEHDPINGKEPSQWVVVARRAGDLGDLINDARWQSMNEGAHPPLWRDDFSNIVSVFKWK